MEDRIKKALGRLDDATVVHTPLSISSGSVDVRSNSSSNNNNVDSNHDIEDKEEGTLEWSGMSLYRPWSSSDYYKRVQTFTILKWFAKPSLVDPLQCARFGWINCDSDMIECVTCNKRLYFNIPSTLTKQTRLERIKEFATMVRSTEHKDTCPWRDNGSPAFYARLINIPSQSQVENFRKRASNIYSKLCQFSTNQELPNVDTSFWIPIQKGNIKNILDLVIDSTKIQSIQNNNNTQSSNSNQSNNNNQGSLIQQHHNHNDLRLKLASIISLCGWDIYKADRDDIKDNNNSKDKKKEKEEDSGFSLHCSYCQRLCGVWNFGKLNQTQDPFQACYPTNANNAASGGNKEIKSLLTKRGREDEDYETKVQISVEGLIGRIMTPNKETMNNGVYKGFSDTKKVRNSAVGWSWGTSFVHHASQSLQESIETNQQKLKPFSPITEHRWFCPWIIDSQDEIISIDQSNNNQPHSSTQPTESNNSGSNNTNTNDSNQQPNGWENLLQILTNTHPKLSDNKKLEDLNVKEIINNLG